MHFLRALFITAALICTIGMYPYQLHANADVEYFTVLEDVPLMPALTYMPEDTVVFDKPTGRIVEEVALVNDLPVNGVPANDAYDDVVFSFYDDVLPQLGWKVILKGHYIREDERLVLTINSVDGKKLVKFKLSPSDQTD